MLKNYGMTEEEYNKKIKESGNCCEICGGTNQNGDSLCIDHNHKTHENRGLLCHKCNNGVGHFKDDVTLLRKAIDYLNKYDS